MAELVDAQKLEDFLLNVGSTPTISFMRFVFIILLKIFFAFYFFFTIYNLNRFILDYVYVCFIPEKNTVLI